MKIAIDLQKEGIEDLNKCIELLQIVVENKKNNRPITEGLEKFNTPKQPELTSTPAKKFQDQEKLIGTVDLSIIAAARR